MRAGGSCPPRAVITAADRCSGGGHGRIQTRTSGTSGVFTVAIIMHIYYRYYYYYYYCLFLFIAGRFRGTPQNSNRTRPTSPPSPCCRTSAASRRRRPGAGPSAEQRDGEETNTRNTIIISPRRRRKRIVNNAHGDNDTVKTRRERTTAPCDFKLILHGDRGTRSRRRNTTYCNVHGDIVITITFSVLAETRRREARVRVRVYARNEPNSNFTSEKIPVTAPNACFGFTTRACVHNFICSRLLITCYRI